MALRRLAWGLALITLALGGMAQSAAARSIDAAQFAAQVDHVRKTMNLDPARAGQEARQLEEGIAAAPDSERPLRTAKVLWLEAEGALRLGDADEAEWLLKRAFAQTSSFRDHPGVIADLMMTKGLLDITKGRVAAGLGDFQRAHDGFRSAKDARGTANSLIYIATLYGDANDQDRVIRYSLEARNAYAGDPVLLTTINNNLAQAYREKGNYPAAAKYIRDALRTVKATDSNQMVVRVLENQARIQLLAGDLAGADRSIAEVLALKDRPGAESERPFIWATAAQAALQHGRLDQAVTLIRKSFAGIDPKTTTATFRENHETAYAIFRKAGDTQDALVHLTAVKRLDDQVNKLAISSSAALMGARFDYANQELRISRLKADELQRTIQFERARARTRTMILTGAGGVTLVIIVMLGVGLVTIRRSRDEVRRANVGLAETNEALQKALVARTEFLATTSHEIRTPLNGILGMTQVMRADASLDPAMREKVDIVHSAGITMRALVDDILDVAKMETGNMTIEAAALDLCGMLKDMCRLWEEQAHAKGLTFSLEVSDCPAMVRADATRVRQVIFNLLSNAMKFTTAGGVRVIGGASGEGDARRFTVTIIDSGIGIAADKLDEIFESFRQADTSTTRQFGGTGLGLTICRKLAHAMGGDVTVASIAGQGSTFTLSLPLESMDAAATAPSDREERVVLVVDRNPITSTMFRTMLTPLGGTVVVTPSIGTALERIGGGGIVRVLIDDATVRADPEGLDGLTRFAQAARVAGAFTVLLWALADDGDPARFGTDRVIARPVAKAALVEQFFAGADNGSGLASTHLVSVAA